VGAPVRHQTAGDGGRSGANTGAGLPADVAEMVFADAIMFGENRSRIEREDQRPGPHVRHVQALQHDGPRDTGVGLRFPPDGL
jgi:hypothetical protein